MEFRSERCTGRISRAGGLPRAGRPRPAPVARLAALALAAATAVSAFGVRPAAAGALLDLDPFGRDRLQSELERTDQVLARAAESLRDCDSPRAKGLFGEARKLQDEARSLYATGGPTVPSARILILTRRARELAVDAIEQCQVEVRAHEELRLLLDSTSALLEDARSAVVAGGSAEARRLLDAGLFQLERARDAYRAGQYRRAILLGGAARNLLHRALDRARGTGDAGGPGSRLDLSLDRTDALLAELRGLRGLEENVRARTLLEKAEREQERARGLRERGAALAALRRTQSARGTALDALWQFQRAPDPDRLREATAMVERLLAEAAPEVEASGSPGARDLLETAQEQLRIARSELAGGSSDRAAKALRTADSLLRRAVEKAAR